MAEKEHKLPYTAEDIENKLKQIDDNKEDIRKLSATVNDLKENGTGSGVTTAMTESLWAIMQKTAFAEALTDDELTAFKTAWGITDTEEDSGEDEEVTLSSISATYSGGSVLVGTSVDDLTGIVVTASYSDGTTATVTDYSLSGTIAEGSNTVTITYESMTTTITVIGYAEDEEEITLSSISATYTGGEVTEGTALTSLTGITVTGTYSDGSTSEITGYELSGEIVEGENTITVSYGGLTTTFEVTGYVKEVIDTSPVIAQYDVAYQSASSSTAVALASRTGMCVTEVYEYSSLAEAYAEAGVVDETGTMVTNVNYLPKIGFYIPYTNYSANAEEKGYSTSSITRYSKIAICTDGTPGGFISNGSYSTDVEATGTVGSVNNSNFDLVNPNGLAFTLFADDADDSYAYWSMNNNSLTLLPDGVNDGDIIFAGKNTKYYGMSNISEYTGE